MISQKFIQVSKAIRRYEKGKFDEWKETVNKRAMDCLKQPIFKTDERGTIIVNFDSALVVLIRESKYLDRMGFAVPETALNVTLQEDKYHAYVESLNAMLSTYSSVISSLSAVETDLLRDRITELGSDLKRGFDLLNWNSLSIPEFTDSCLKAINNFQTIVKQIQKNAATVKSVVDAISNVELMRKPSHAAHEVTELSSHPIPYHPVPYHTHPIPSHTIPYPYPSHTIPYHTIPSRTHLLPSDRCPSSRSSRTTSRSTG
jgi:dynein heavy chain